MVIGLIAEIWGLIALAFFTGGGVGWGFAVLWRLLAGSDAAQSRDERIEDSLLAIPLPAPLVLSPPRLDEPLRTPALIEMSAVQSPPRRPSMIRPLALSGPRDGHADALQRIPGIDHLTMGELHRIGIYHFSQIAAWTPQELAWIGAHLDIGDLPVREDWVGHAVQLAVASRPKGPPRG